MIERLLKNIDTELAMLREISDSLKRLPGASAREHSMLSSSIESLRNSIKLINASIPQILKYISLAQPLGESATSMEKIEVIKGKDSLNVTLDKKARAQFLDELRINQQALSQLRKKEGAVEQIEFKSPRTYIKIANKFCIGLSRSFIEHGRFKQLGIGLKKSNMDILLESYVSMMLFTTFLSFFAGVLLAVFLLFFSVSLSAPFFSIYAGSYLSRLLWTVFVPFVVPLTVFFALYLYPATEQSSLAKHIDQELPFAVVHMSAISGSGVEPTSIFRIIAFSTEYPYLRKEIRKVLNQINLYGYDLVTALGNVARTSPSQKLAELFAGLSTTISSGGSLSDFFEKRAETLLIGYRLEREKFTKAAETFMDLYITVVIAAPMILLLIFVLLSISDFGTSFSPTYMTFIIITLIALVNIIFLAVLHIKQPKY